MNNKIIKKILLKTIGFYQKFLSPFFFFYFRFYPTCSDYASRAIEKYGIFKGLIKGFWRILRCNPYNKGGINLP